MTLPYPRIIPFVALLLMAGALPAAAQSSQRSSAESMGFGFRLGRDFADDEWTAGGDLHIPLGRMFELRPSGDLALSHIGDDYQLNGDVAIHGPRNLAYLGAGIGWVNRDFKSGKTSGTGVNFFLGFKPFPRPGAQLYLEVRWTLVNSEKLFRLDLGAEIPIRKR
jgi:hypothetical protein